jgi:hydrogenase-4 component E
MNSISDQLLMAVLLINILILGTHRIQVSIRALSAQGVILAILPLSSQPTGTHIVAISLFVFLAKGVCIPWLLFNALRKIDFGRELPPLLGYSGNILAGAVVTALAFAFAARLPLAAAHQGVLLVPTAIATCLCGFVALACRRKAINQVVGYLLLENGIFIFGLLLTQSMPLMVEAGSLLDLIAGIFVMGIIINQINREFSSIDTGRLTALKEVE